MVRVAQRGRFSVYVYDETGERHHAAHCHVRWVGGRTAVELPDLGILAGPSLPAEAWELLNESKADLIVTWNRLNPGSPIA